MDNDDIQTLSRGCWLAIIGAMVVIAIGAGLTVFALKIQHDVVNPQVRQNMVDDPQTTIVNRRDFHNKLAEVQTADSNILTDLTNMSLYDKGSQAYDNAVNDLTGIEQIRATAISNYNANASNPDLSKDMEPWMPKSLNASALPADHDTMSTYLNSEIKALQNVIDQDKNKGDFLQ